MIKQIVFDIGNVLLEVHLKKTMDAWGFSEKCQEAVTQATVKNPYWYELDRSAVPDEDVLKGCIAKAPKYEKEIRMFYERHTDFVTPFSYAAPWIRDLKAQGFKVYLLSNYGVNAFAVAKNKMDFLTEVDGFVLSCQIKALKPEPEIYMALEEKYGILPQETIFLDDNAANVEGAKKRGYHAFLFTSYEEAQAVIKAESQK
ncbi:MAG: HAD family phosphatase [Clostridia bacterium]|nr:HAD family phosphatase [Clostridia bacterium]